MKHLVSRSKFGFSGASLHKKKEPGGLHYLRDRTSFVIAACCLFAFVIGNMAGQHGWYAFWASVVGGTDDALIAYTGTVPPLEHVVDYGCWARYGGDYKQHTFRQAPQQCLESLPAYIATADRDDRYSMQYMSSYQQQVEGSGKHAGVDIRVPIDTPVHAVMAGRVAKAGNQPNGFGRYIVLAHPNVPDPDNPNGGTTTLYSTYAHLSAVYVAVGDVVQKGKKIGLSGNTGFSTGPHLDFRLVRDSAPFLPYDPGNQTDGYTHTINPLLYVQSNYQLASPTVVANRRSAPRRAVDPEQVVAPRRARDVTRAPVVAQTEPESEPVVTTKTVIARLQSSREARLRERLRQRDSRRYYAAKATLRTGLLSTTEAQPTQTPVVAAERTYTETNRQVASVSLRHDGSFARGWEKVTIELLDDDGHLIRNPDIQRDYYLKAAYGQAEFRPAVLTALDFNQGKAVVHMLPRGRQTVVFRLLPFTTLSAPLRYER